MAKTVVISVKTLLAELDLVDQDLKIVLSADAEGNGHNLLDGISFGTFNIRTGEIKDYSEKDLAKKQVKSGTVKALILWPQH